MFGLLTGAVENLLDVVDSVIDGDAPTKKQIAKLVDDGVSIAVIASAFGVAEDVIHKLMED